MFENFQESSRTADVKDLEIQIPDQKTKPEYPSMDELKSKMEDIFPPPPSSRTMSDAGDVAPVEPRAAPGASEVPNSDTMYGKDTRTITLGDGTVVEIPSGIPSVNHADASGATEGAETETKQTRELTEEEKAKLKETLGWTDKQIAKCTIDEDGVIHYKTDREDMEGKTGENGVRYERKTVDINGIKVQGVFPVFESACDVQLPKELEKASNAQQFKECNRQLKERVADDPELRETFTDEQLEDIEDGDTPRGYVWHHNEETGKMQLVKIEDHDRTQGGAAHTGGKALWGGGYSNHETAASSTNETNESTSTKEVE